ncbi:AI-2E family transporter [Clostridium sp.]|jgi:predicted PurR-regulated permease PerM|uniref:AI-2E family transporter n=1 Tax=Clostridium sp. TaxID=1506 RepID=UPI003EE9D69A
MKKVSKIKLVIGIVSIILFLVVIGMAIRIPIIKQLTNLVIISFVVAYILKPIYMVLINKYVNKKLASALIIVGLVGLIILTFVLIIPSIFSEGSNLNKSINDLGKYLTHANSKIKILNKNKVMSGIVDTVYSKANAQIIVILDKILSLIMSLSENLITYMVSPLIIYYFLCDSENMINKALIIFPPESRNIIKKTIEDIDKILGKYIISQLILCGFITVATFFILLFLKVDFPLILALINGIFNIIPYFGPIFGVIPAIFISLLISPKTALYVVVCFFVLQQIEGDVLSPKIIGDSISMHPLTVIILLLIGGSVGGILGMIIAVPLGVIVKVIYQDLNYYLF